MVNPLGFESSSRTSISKDNLDQVEVQVLSTSSWKLPIALYLAAIEDDLAVHKGGRHSRGSSLSARSSGFSSFFKVSS